MYLCVTGCEHYDGGDRRVYHLNDGGTIEERRSLPEVSRWLCWDNRGHRIYKRSAQSEMRRAAERFKKRFKFV